MNVRLHASMKLLVFSKTIRIICILKADRDLQHCSLSCYTEIIQESLLSMLLY